MPENEPIPEFSLEDTDREEQPAYRDKILKIISDYEEAVVRMIEPDDLMHRELHQKKVIDAKQEVREFQETREDICKTFGVPLDNQHIYLHIPTATKDGPVLQRAFRVFSVLIDVLKREAFYGEGRTDHMTLLNNIAVMIKKETEPYASIIEIVESIDQDPAKFLLFKGIISKNEEGFQNLSENSNRLIETPIYDSEGNKIETPKDWFLTGHNLPGPKV